MHLLLLPNNMSSLTETQINALNITIFTTGAIGIASTFYLIYFLFANHRMLRNPTGRLTVSLAFCDLVNGIFKTIGRSWLNQGALCSFQAFVLGQFALSEWIICTLIAGYSVMTVCYGKSINYFKKTEGLFLASVFLVPLPFSITSIALPNILGDASLYCWISNANASTYQLYLYTIPILFLLCVNLYCVFAISVVSYKYGQSNIFGETVTYKRYLMIRFFGYELLFWVSYFPTIINRIASAISGVSSFPILLLQATISPLQGAFHLAIFSYILEFNPVRETEREEYAEMNIFTSPSDHQIRNQSSVAELLDLPSPNPVPLMERNVSVNVMEMEQSNLLNIIQI